jgi:hypothetical protein
MIEDDGIKHTVSCIKKSPSGKTGKIYFVKQRMYFFVALFVVSKITSLKNLGH